MKLIALTILVCVVHTVTGWCTHTGLKKKMFSEIPEPLPERIRRRFNETEFNDTDTVWMYQVYPNNMRLDKTFYAVFVATTDENHVYFKVRVKGGELGHLSNFTKEDFEYYYRNCHSDKEAPPLQDIIKNYQ